MRSNLLVVVAGALLAGGVTFAADAESLTTKREFKISNEQRDLMMENSTLSLLREETVQREERVADLTFGTFVGRSTLKDQRVNMSYSTTDYDFDELLAVGMDAKKHLSPNMGWGVQVEYQNYRDQIAALHIVPATLYGFGRTREMTRLRLRAVAELGYSAAYVRQIGTAARTGGLGGRAAFWQGGFEVPLKTEGERWSLGLFYSRRFAPSGEFDLTDDTVKLQGSLTL